MEGQPFDNLRALAAKEGIPSNKLREFTPKGGESLQEVKRRVVDFFSNQLIESVSNGSQVLIVSHGGIIREIMKYFRDELNCHFKSSPDIRTPNTSVSEFKLFYMNNKLISGECVKIHDIQHLTGECKTLALKEQTNETNNEDNRRLIAVNSN